MLVLFLTDEDVARASLRTNVCRTRMQYFAEGSRDGTEGRLHVKNSEQYDIIRSHAITTSRTCYIWREWFIREGVGK